MPKVIKDESTGAEETVFTQAELDAQLKEKDDHHKEKIDEFVKGKEGFEQKDKERDQAVADAKKIAEDAITQVNQTKAQHNAAVQNFALEQLAGADPDLRKKIEDALPLINMEIKEDKDILEKVRLASNMIGGPAVAPNPLSMPFMGGFTPSAAPKDGSVTDQDHNQFLKEIGLSN